MNTNKAAPLSNRLFTSNKGRPKMRP